MTPIGASQGGTGAQGLVSVEAREREERRRRRRIAIEEGGDMVKGKRRKKIAI